MKLQLLTLLLFFLFTNLLAQPTAFTSKGMGGGGAMFSPSISPYDDDEVFLVCDMAGVYHTTNAGQSWSKFHYNELISDNKSKVQFTSDPNILYNIRQVTGAYEVVPVKSTNGGQNWSPINTPNNLGGWTSYLFADPNNTNRLVLGDFYSFYFSNDGGANWSEIYVAPSGQMHIANVFWDGDDIYVGTNFGMHVSTNGGSSFSIASIAGFPSGGGIFSMAAAKENGTIRFFAVAVTATEMQAGSDVHDMDDSHYLGLFKMDWGGSWTDASSDIPSDNVIYLVDMSLSDIDILYASASDSQGLPMVYKTTNAGGSWSDTFITTNNQNITTGYGGYWGDLSWFFSGAAVGLDVSNTNPNIIVTTDFAFAHISQDGGTTWRQMYVDPAYENSPGSSTPNGQDYISSGLDVTTSHTVFWLSATEIFLGYTDVGAIYSGDAGSTWTLARKDENAHQNWYRIVKNNTTGQLFATVTDINDIYMDYRIDDDLDTGDGAVYVTSNNGVTWSKIYDFAKTIVWIAIDPNNPSTMYASIVHSTQGGIYKSTDAGVSWTATTTPPRTEGHPYNIRILGDGSIVASFSARMLANGNFTASAGVFYSTDGGTTWEDRTHTDMQYYTKDVTIDPNDENVWYATVWDGWNNLPGNKGGLYKTSNKGLTWTRIWTISYPQSATVEPGNASSLYVATEMEGLWHSNDATATNPSFSVVAGFDYPRAHRVFFNPHQSGELWVTTYGGSVQVSDAVSLAVELEDFSAQYLAPENAVEVKWIARSETNFSHYELERKSGNQPFKKIATLSGKNQQTTSSFYRILDTMIAPDQFYYYRLKSIDVDGSFDYSSVQAVRTGSVEGFVQVFPNPVGEERLLQIETQYGKDFLFRIFDTHGKIVFSKNIQGNTTIQLQNIPDGWYAYQIVNDFRNISGKILLK